MKYLSILALLFALSITPAVAQFQTTVQVTKIDNITSSSTVIDNRSIISRRNTMHTFHVSGSGSWSVTIQYADTLPTSWTNFPGTGITVTNAGPADGIGGAYGYHDFIRFNITGSVSVSYTGQQSLYIPTSGAGAIGTVTSVGLSLPAQFSVSGSPVTSSGTLAASWVNQSANTILAGPTTGAAAAPTFRALVAADLPSFTVAFNNLASGTNTSAAMLVGAGASLQYTSTGIVNANQILGTALTSLYGNSGKLQQASGVFTSGNVHSSDASGNTVDSGVVAANIVTSTGSLTSALPVFGNGSKSVVIGTLQGNTTKLISVSGAFSTGDVTSIDASGNLIDASVVAANIVTATSTLTSALPIFGNGSKTVTPGTVQGNTTKVVTYAGSAPSTNDCAKFDLNGNLTTAGAACGTTSIAFSGITTGTNTGQTLTVGNSSTVTFTGTGIINANQILGTTISSLYGNSGKIQQATGSFTSGNVHSSDASGNTVDSGVVAANIATAASTLTSGIPVFGNGSKTLTLGSVQGNTTKVVTYAGSAPSTNDCAKFDANGNITTNGSSCGGGSGTVTSVATGCGLSGGTITTTGTVKSSEARNAQTGTTYTILDGDCGKVVSTSNASSIAITLPQANGSTFVSGWWIDIANIGAGTATITPTTSTINGAATLVLVSGQGARIVSDGTNYVAILGTAGTAPSGTGCVAAASNSFTATRTITAGSGIAVTNGDCTGNPTISADTAVMVSGADLGSGAWQSFVASGTNTYTGCPAQALAAYPTSPNKGYFTIQFTNASTGASTINICSLGAKKLLKNDRSTQIGNNDIPALSDWGCVYDSTADGGSGACVMQTSPFTTLLTSGTSVTLTPPRAYYVCTSTCTVTLPVPAAGYEFCVRNGNNVSKVITLAALGSSASYENTANSAYGTAGTGTFVSGGAVGDKVCIVGLDSTHYLTLSYNGSWTAN